MSRHAIFIGIGLVLGLISTSIGLINGQEWSGFWLNLGTEFLGAVMIYISGFLIIERWEKQREEERKHEAEKKKLLHDFGSRINEDARRAAERISSMRDFRVYELTGQTFFRGADHTGSEIIGFNLESVHWNSVIFKDAVLTHTLFNGAILQGAIFKGANLSHTEFRGADLTDAVFHGAKNTDTAIFDEYTIMPNGEPYNPRTNHIKSYSQPSVKFSENPFYK
ncbi:MAG: pentapeptide repeat-containing protein [Chloroflexi bacterium]|nr:pentapeptide repeat-containing protein [Chloroflexota bacterium]